MGKTGFMWGLFIGLAIAIFLYSNIHIPLLSDILQGISSAIGAITSSKFILYPVIFGIIGYVVSKK